ncbi:MAG: translocation/assembly module TamB domain-containing protein [Haliscomenobacter sp.]|nr:translocation/assembly module TamB domain-containing protein [Haliscomenobacter sp.]
MTTNRLLGLETRKGQNKQFYGTAIGRGEVAFSGSFRQPDIYVNAEVGEGTRMVIPVSSDRKANSLNFISFVDKDKSQSAIQPATSAGSLREIKGVSFEMDLIANESALLQIIFNEQAGDIIEGSGRGALHNRAAKRIFSNVRRRHYRTGEYLFTLYNVINKDFSIKRGRNDHLTGDPSRL